MEPTVTDPAHPAPGRLELVRRFANTDDRYGRRDALADPARAAAWLSSRDLPGRDQPPTRAELDELLELRAILRDLAAANTGKHAPSSACVVEFNRLASTRTCIVQLGFTESELFGAALLSGQPGIAAITAELIAAVHEAVLTGTWARLKACANADCRWLFYDTSRSRTGRWCSMAACGSLHKARTYRRRNQSRC